MTDRNEMRKKFLPGILRPIVDRLKAQRRRRDLTQQQLAARVGLAQSYIAKIEAGTADFSISRLVELSRILDLEVVLVPKHKLSTVDAVLREQAIDSSDIKELLGIEDIEQ
jgi:transcriptional regulator with XRE-family HTH domain